MDIALIITGVMAVLKPLLEKGSESAAETIGKKIAEGAVSKGLWLKVKNLFIDDNQKEIIDLIESKKIATSSEIELVENKLTTKLESNIQFAAEFKSEFNFSSTDYLVAEELLESIRDGQEKLKKLFQDRRDDPSIETVGQYKIMLRRTQERLNEDETIFLALVKKKGFR